MSCTGPLFYISVMEWRPQSVENVTNLWEMSSNWLLQPEDILNSALNSTGHNYNLIQIDNIQLFNAIGRFITTQQYFKKWISYKNLKLVQHQFQKRHLTLFWKSKKKKFFSTKTHETQKLMHYFIMKQLEVPTDLASILSQQEEWAQPIRPASSRLRRRPCLSCSKLKNETIKLWFKFWVALIRTDRYWQIFYSQLS